MTDIELADQYDGTAALSGAATTGGVYTCTITATNSAGSTDRRPPSP
jgi:hypothetical protein